MSSVKAKSVVGILAVLLLGWGIGLTELNGQIGGFIKKKAKDIMQPSSGNKQESAPGNNPTPAFNENVLELNADALAKLDKALTCEKDFRDGVEAKYAKLPGKEEYQNCMIQVMMSPEAQAIAEGKNTDVSQMGVQLMALQEKKCGKNPERAKDSKGEELRSAREQGAKCGGLTLTQYSIAMERIAPFCNSGGKDKVKSYGEIYYVYTPTEVSAIQPQCAALTGLISAINAAPKK
jgi:hypothetical protein